MAMRFLAARARRGAGLPVLECSESQQSPAGEPKQRIQGVMTSTHF